MDHVRIGFIGAGGLATRVHYPSLVEIESASIEAICDLNEQRLNEAGEKFAVEKRFARHKEMLDSVELDAVYIVMPPHLMHDLVVDCLNRKKHIFVEKPLGVHSLQAVELAKLAERNGCLTMVGFNRRFMPVLVKARAMVEERGPITHCMATFFKNYDGNMPFFRGATDILTADGIHCVDTLRWLCGEAKAAASDINRFGVTYENSFNAVMRFAGGATAILNTNWSVGTRVHCFEIHGRGVSAFINPDATCVVYKDNDKLEEGVRLDPAGLAGSADYHKVQGFFQENMHFIECIRAGRAPMSNFSDAAKTMLLIDRIRESRICE
ncbi:MAG: Gfo/Idh/MocA family oxidoreductase [Planctomycetota bacterium]